MLFKTAVSRSDLETAFVSVAAGSDVKDVPATVSVGSIEEVLPSFMNISQDPGDGGLELSSSPPYSTSAPGEG